MVSSIEVLSGKVSHHFGSDSRLPGQISCVILSRGPLSLVHRQGFDTRVVLRGLKLELRYHQTARQQTFLLVIHLVLTASSAPATGYD